ncbi:MAG: hypothetical protein A2289_25990 [Deltaproteobacteria bacterium RIFOXYA12_FULL_58_15]|nr:MAG: hypothetical protein A2289_25990 [Deltaproteobacteria bacterium RIFOXYA12_FULL_58_15]OGR11641.1 MAG: hypothetical protein A2341_02705 [Deltaproteobacteria bacterium RIFOXYB12_FULL_58_9]
MSLSHRQKKLIAKYLDKTATKEELHELEGQLDDQELRGVLTRSQSALEAIDALPLLDPSCDLVGRAEKEFQQARHARARHARSWPWPVRVVSALAAAAGVVVVGGWLLFGQSEGRQQTLPPLDSPEQFVVTASQGRVWRDVGTSRQPLAVGDVVSHGQRVGTDADSSVTLMLDLGLTVHVDETSQATVASIGKPHNQLLLSTGAIRAVIDSLDERVLEIELEGSLSHVEIRSGAVGVLTDGQGTAVVGCTLGEAVLVESDRQTTVAAGFEMVSDKLGGALRRSPGRLDLSVPTLGPVPHDARFVKISGQTTPGAQVWVNGETVAVRNDGAFTVELEVTPDQEKISVRARDLHFRKQGVLLAVARQRGPQRSPLPVRPTPPTPVEDLDVDVEWENEKTPG